MRCKSLSMSKATFPEEHRGWRIWDGSGWNADAAREFLTAPWLARNKEGTTARCLLQVHPATPPDISPTNHSIPSCEQGKSLFTSVLQADAQARQQTLAYVLEGKD